MDSNNTIIEKIISFAKKRADISAVLLNGSRADKNAPVDEYQDFDIVFVVNNPIDYKNDQKWISEFGNLLLMQQNDITEDEFEWYIFLMQFENNFRLDASFFPESRWQSLLDEKMQIVLLDKAGRFSEIAASTDIDYHTKKPSEKDFLETINEIFWCSTNVAKGICRDELVYSSFMLESIVREPFIKLIEYYIALRNNWSVNSGKFGRWFKKYLQQNEWSKVESTYFYDDLESMYNALIGICTITSEFGAVIAETLGYRFPQSDYHGIITHLNCLKQKVKPWVR